MCSAGAKLRVDLRMIITVGFRPASSPWIIRIYQTIYYRPEHNTGTPQITDQDDCRPGQSEKNDEEVKRKWGVKVRRVQGGKGQEGRMKGKESRKQAESEEEEEGGETEQQRQEGGGEKAKDERAGERRVISRVGLEGKGAAEDTFANCLKDSSDDLLDRLPKQF
jgi:hypothetical protein